MSKADVVYYKNSSGKYPTVEFIDSLPKSTKAKIFRIFTYIEEYGTQIKLPHIKKLTGTPLCEIRILGKDSIRIIFFIPNKNIIFILHCFIKRKQKTPIKELNIALERYKRIIDK